MRNQSLITLSLAAVALTSFAPAAAHAQSAVDGDLGAGPYFIGTLYGGTGTVSMDGCPAGDVTVFGRSASHEIPTAGVVTEFRADRIGAPGAAFSFRIGTYEHTGSGIAQKPLATVPAKLDGAGNAVVPVRIPVTGGMYVGMTRPAGSQVACMMSASERGVSSAPGLGPDGSLTPFTYQPETTVPVVAKWEGDDDEDGFGDATQDKCLAAPGPNDGCAEKPKPATCKVPRVIGLNLTVAKQRLTAAGCAVGTAKRARGARGRLVVRTQSWPARTTAPGGTKVALKLGRA